MSAPHNPSAFPVNTTNEPNVGSYAPDPGMTLRDWFAGQAISGICAHVDTWGLSDADIVERAYKLSDLMLREREK